MLIVVFGVHWNAVPGPGLPARRVGRSRPAPCESLVLPTVTLALSQGAVLLRFVRSATLDVLHQDYIRTARAKGLTRTQALYRHGLRNASLPIISILGVQIASLIAGVVVIERVFNLPGVGQMLVRDIGVAGPREGPGHGAADGRSSCSSSGSSSTSPTASSTRGCGSGA